MHTYKWRYMHETYTIYPMKYTHSFAVHCFMVVISWAQCKKIRKIFTGLTHKLLFSITVISDVYRSFIQNKTTFTKYCLTQWISKLPRSFEIHWARQYLVNFMGLAGMFDTTGTIVYNTMPNFTGIRYSELSQSLALWVLNEFMWFIYPHSSWAILWSFQSQ